MNGVKFWMVYNPNGRAPTVMHPSEESARSEAARLAVQQPTDRFIILESVCEYGATVAVYVTGHEKMQVEPPVAP